MPRVCQRENAISCRVRLTRLCACRRRTQDVGGLASFAISVAPPADGVPPALPRLPCVQLAEFALVDGFGEPITLEWLARRLGGPGAPSPAAAAPPQRSPSERSVPTDALAPAGASELPEDNDASPDAAADRAIEAIAAREAGRAAVPLELAANPSQVGANVACCRCGHSLLLLSPCLLTLVPRPSSLVSRLYCSSSCCTRRPRAVVQQQQRLVLLS